ncbi:thioredoxin-dependent peroxiredoxin [Trifolium repens]|nr:thioredoxin-dependent peroxiredoxin [Trifolium repens]
MSGDDSSSHKLVYNNQFQPKKHIDEKKSQLFLLSSFNLHNWQRSAKSNEMGNPLVLRLLQIGCMFIQVEFVIFCYTPRKSIIILLFTSLKMV